MDTYTGSEIEVLSTWGRPETPTLPSIKVNGYVVEVCLWSDAEDRQCPTVGEVYVDGRHLDGTYLFSRLPEHPGWEAYYATTGCTYAFNTIFEALAHAVEYLV